MNSLIFVFIFFYDKILLYAVSAIYNHIIINIMLCLT